MKIIRVLNTVNKKTYGAFYLFMGVFSLLILSAFLHFTGNEIVVEMKDEAPIGIIFLGYFLHTLLLAIIGMLVALALWILVLVKTWIMDDLVPAFKDAINENYDVKTDSKSKVNFQ